MIDTLLQDLRFAFRALAKSPGFAAVAILTLALGIGANTAIFSVLYGVLLRPLPYPEPQQLVGIAEVYQGSRDELAVTFREFRFLADNAPGLASAAATTNVGFTVFGDGAAVHVDGQRVSHDYFRTLGVHPFLGRDFLADEDQQDGPRVAILSYGFWRRQFGGDTTIVGRSVALDGRPCTIVGVMPAGFVSTEAVDVWSTLSQVARSIGGGENLHFIGRMRAGLPDAEARAGFATVVAGFREAFKARLSQEVGIELAPYRTLVAGSLRGPVRLLFGAIGLVLLIACANVANLVLGRAATRGRELAIRVAVGATHARLFRQLLTESVVLGILGGVAGLLFAGWGLGLLVALVPPELTQGLDIRLDRWALFFTAGLSIVTGIAFGFVPAWQAARQDPHEGLKEGSGQAVGARMGGGRVRHGLVVVEIALSLVLLTGAGLLIQTVARLVGTDPGFEGRNVIAAEIWLTGTRYDSTAKIADYYDRLRARLTAIPGVRSAGVIEAGIPLVRGGNLGVTVDGEFPRTTINYRTVTPGYFETMAIPLLQGRTFTAADQDGAEPVVIVSESFARRFLGDDLGAHRLAVGGGKESRRVVGVVGDVRQFIGAPPLPTVFIPSTQTPAGLTWGFNGWFPIHVVVRTAQDPRSFAEIVARAIRETDATVPTGRVRTMTDVLRESLAFRRFVMLLLSAFAGLAALLAAIGIYGVMSYAVAQRTHEIGVRMALGAGSRDVLRLVLVRGVGLTAGGVLVGAAGAVAATRLLQSLLYGVGPTDPLTFAGAASLLIVTGLVAAFVPAQRAAHVDPMAALRSE